MMTTMKLSRRSDGTGEWDRNRVTVLPDPKFCCS